MRRLALLALLSSTFVLATAWPQDEGKPPAPKDEAPKKKVEKKPVKVGTVIGLVKNRWMRREPALIHVKAIKGMKFKPPKKPVVMDQENLVFKPHLLAVLKGTKVQFPNSDSVKHNVYSPPKASSKPFNLGTYAAGVTKEVVLDIAGEVPLLCNVHTEMSAYIIVTETPFFVWTDKKGAFRLKGVPVGKRRIELWHERFRSQEVVVDVVEGKTTEVTFKKLEKR